MRKNFAEAEKSCTFAVQKPERSVAPEAKSETQTKLERCRSGRSGRSRKPLYPYGYPGFESLSFRKKQPLGLLFLWKAGMRTLEGFVTALGAFGAQRRKLLPWRLVNQESLSFRQQSKQYRCRSNTYGGDYFIYIQKHIQIPWESTTHTKASVS